MTVRYQYTFFYPVKDDSGKIDHYGEITLKKAVTDRMEERSLWKKVYAANYFQRIIRNKYGMKYHTVRTKNIEKI